MMDRLTNKKTAADLKANADGLKAKGIEPNMSDLRYIKLAEYENVSEFIQMTTNAPVLSYQVAMIKELLDGKAVKCKVNITDKPTKTIDETSVYELDDEPKDETKWLENNPSINIDGKSIKDIIMRRFMEKAVIMENHKPYRFEYCVICKRQLIVQNVDGWTGKELPIDAPYVCDDCKRKQEKEQREKMSESEKQWIEMFVNYVTDSKCKRNRAIPCEICKAVFNDCEGV